MWNNVINDTQKAVLSYIKQAVKTQGYPPTMRDICAGVGLKSTSSVQAHLDALERLGYIRRPAGKRRAIEIIEDESHTLPHETTNVPLVGMVAAGQPILAEENIQNYYPIPVEHLPNAEHDHEVRRPE